MALDLATARLGSSLPQVYTFPREAAQRIGILGRRKAASCDEDFFALVSRGVEPSALAQPDSAY